MLGALLLFCAVQVTMIGYGLWSGERMRRIQVTGFFMAIAGLISLLSPGLSTPPLENAALMLAAGVAWGIYSLRGKRFGFSLEEIRQLLDLYDMGDQQATQLQRTYEVAQARLQDMVEQRDELNEAIDDLKEQLKWGEKVIVSFNATKKAAE